jgi:hypothetical protein
MLRRLGRAFPFLVPNYLTHLLVRVKLYATSIAMSFSVLRLLFCSVFLGVGLSSSFSQELRVWHDRNGQEIRAILKKLEGDKVLMLKDGKEFFFDISILSDEDQAHVRAWASRGRRTIDGLLALYDFGLAAGATVRDVSGVEPALDLQIVNAKAVKRSKGSLEIRGNTMIRSIKVPTKIIKTVKGTGQLTVEVWVRPANLKQEGPARIVTISKDTSNRNFTLGQDGHNYDLRLRTSKTSRNGMPSMPAPAKSVTTKLSHLAYSRERSGKARFFINGKQVAEKNVSGDLKNWDGSYRLCLGNEFSNDRAWKGSYHLVAVYGRALSPQEVKKSFEAGAGADTSGLLAARKLQEGGHLFETQVAPLLAKHCLECHDTSISKGKLDLTRRASAFAGGEEGPPIVPGKPEESLLLEVVESNDMPKKRAALTVAEKKVLRDWIQAGAPWTLDYVDAATYVHDSHGPGNWVRRLTIPEYVATVKSVTGVEIGAEARRLLPSDLRADGFSNTAYNLKVDFKHVEAFAKLAEIVVKRMDLQAFAKRFHNKLTLDKEIRALMQKMGKWILRGPLDEREVGLYRGITTTMASSGASFEQAVGSAIEAMLQSPRFIYRIEDQRESDSVEGYEMAVRMSYLLWGASPDEELYRAADKGELSDKSKIAAQIRRMLGDPRSVEQSQRFIYDWLDLGRLDNLAPSRTLYPNWNPAIGADMRAETLAFFTEVVWTRKRPLVELLNAQVTFLTPRLAKHYGMFPKGRNFARYDLTNVPGRGGLLTQGSVLTVGGDQASMVTRGLFLLHELLRGVVRDPPPDVDTTPVPTKPGLTQRGISTARLAKSSCSGCHAKFEPLAFGLEKFDGLGSFHQADKHGNRLREDGEVLFPGRSEPMSYKTSAELMKLLADSPRVSETLTWKVVQFAMGRPLGAEDARHVAEIHKASQKEGGTYQSLVTAIILSDLVLLKHSNEDP